MKRRVKGFSEIGLFKNLENVNEEVAKYKMQLIKEKKMKTKGDNRDEREAITTLFK